MDIRKINTDRDCLEWDEWQLDYWEMFDEPKEINACELFMAIDFLYMMNIDINQKEIVTFRAAPVHFVHMIVHYIRQLKARYPKIFAENFCDDIEPDI